LSLAPKGRCLSELGLHLAQQNHVALKHAGVFGDRIQSR